MILLQTMPDPLNAMQLKRELRNKFPDIKNVHDMHIWCLTPGEVVVTTHVLFQSEQVSLQKQDFLTQFTVGT